MLAFRDVRLVSRPRELGRRAVGDVEEAKQQRGLAPAAADDNVVFVPVGCDCHVGVEAAVERRWPWLC